MDVGVGGCGCGCGCVFLRAVEQRDGGGIELNRTAFAATCFLATEDGCMDRERERDTCVHWRLRVTYGTARVASITLDEQKSHGASSSSSFSLSLNINISSIQHPRGGFQVEEDEENWRCPDLVGRAAAMCHPSRLPTK